MIYCISISVYDTTLPAGSVEHIQDYAEKGSVKIVYDGEDNKLPSILSSRVEFSLEVPHNVTDTDLFYETLFTGNEVRYSVVVRDQDNNTLWTGFVLADEYNEPYTTGTFYVRFTATDGLARLKGQVLPDSFYTARQSISKVVTDCLNKTGLSLDLWVNEAIKNNGAGSRWDTLYVDGAAWLSNGTKTDCYDILEGIIHELGCVLFQQDGKWYAIGINKRGVTVPIYNRYDTSGVYVETHQPPALKPKFLRWDATPSISISPPFREVEITTGVEITNTLLPEDIVRQPWTKTAEPQDPPLPKYWTGTGLTPVLKHNNNGAFPTYLGEAIEVTGSAVGAEHIYADPTPTQVLNNYISLITKPYVRGGSGETIDVSFTYTSFWPSPFVNPAEFMDNDVVVYDILLDGSTIISNRSGFSSSGAYGLDFDTVSIGAGLYKVDARLNITDFELPNSGSLDIRFHHLGDVDGVSYTSGYFVISDLSINYIADTTNVFKKRRTLEHTKTHEVSTFHGDTVLDLVPNSFIYQPYMAAGQFTSVTFSAAYIYDSGGDPIGWCLGVSSANYSSLQSNSDRIYVKRNNSDFYEYITDITFVTDAGNYYVLIRHQDGYLTQVGDSLLIRSATGGNPQTTVVRGYREQWKKTTQNTGTQRFAQVLAETIHDIYHRAVISFEGTVTGLIFPLTVLRMQFKNKDRFWVATRITMEPGENTSDIKIMEYVDEKVTDYE